MKASVEEAPFLSWFFSVLLIQLYSVNCDVLPVESSLLHSLCSRKCYDLTVSASNEQSSPYMCSCSPSCAVYNDCCQDSPHRNSGDSVEETDFICLSVEGRGKFRAVSGCPGSPSSDPCKTATGHLPPVTSKVTNTTFANIFCATCNGEAGDLVTWNVELRCSSDGIGESPDDTLEYQSGQLWRLSATTKTRIPCTYHVHFEDYSLIDSLELRSCQDFPKISDCSPSWVDADVFKMCRSYEDPVYFGNVAYRNLHCAACNYLDTKSAKCLPRSMEVMLRMGMADPRLSHFCRQWTLCAQYLDQNRGRSYSFAFLLNIKEHVCVPPRGRRCCEREKYDFRSKRCRKVV